MYRLKAYKTPRGEWEQLPQVERLEDGALVPFDEANVDYQEYLAWVNQGNEAQPWEESSNS